MSELEDLVEPRPADEPIDDASADIGALDEPMPIEAEPADVLEQKQPVPQDDDEYRES
jgi:hypothetical protein